MISAEPLPSEGRAQAADRRLAALERAQLPLFWKSAPDPREYLALLRAFGSAVRGVDPGARIVTGGLFPSPEGGPSMRTFVAELYRGGGARAFDAVGLHAHAGTPREALRRAAELRAAMRRFGDTGKPIWITEVAWASGGAPSGLTVRAERQAAYLRQTFQLATAARERLGIAGVVWYALSDTPGPLWPGHGGLFTVDGRPNSSWAAFAEVASKST